MLLKKQTKREKNIEMFTQKDNAIVEVFLDNIFITHYSIANKKCLVLFEKKRSKPTFNYSFLNDAQFDDYFEKQKNMLQKRHDINSEYLEKQKEQIELFQKDAILYSSWGYEQTNIDFYKIIERKNSFVTIVQIANNKTFEGDDRGTTTPDTEKIISEPFRKKISKYGSINISSFQSASIWKNKPLYFSNYY